MAKRIARWFNDRSLRFKITGLFLLLVLILQLVTGVLVTGVVERKLREDILASNQSALLQMSANVDEVFIDLVDALYPVITRARSSTFYTKREDVERALIDDNIEYQSLYSQLLASGENYRYVNSLLIQSQDGVHSFVSNGYTRLRGDDLFEKLCRDFEGDKRHYIWVSTLEDTYFFAEHREDILSLIVPIRRYNKTRGFVVLNLSVPRLTRYIAAMGSEGREVFLQTPQGSLWPEPTLPPEWAGREAAQNLLTDTNRTPVAYLGDEILMTHRLSVTGWNLVLHYSGQRTDGMDFLMQAIVPLLVGAAILLVVSSGFIVGEVTKPLRKLTRIMRENSRTSGKPLRFNAQYRDEVGVLGEAYNQTMDDLEREQRQSRIAYMAMLQMQIKPHFLYNSMESTRFLIEMGDPKAVEMISAIVTYYKLSLSGVNAVVALREEMEHLACYLQILQIRYASRYSYTLDIPEEMLEDEIEKFTLQPLVENAVYHGIKPKRGQGFVRVRGRREGGDDVVEILDNGVGIPADKLAAIRKMLENDQGMEQTEHIGILNVHQRLRMRYGAGYGLSVESVEGEYTRIWVRIPGKLFHLVEMDEPASAPSPEE